MQDLFTNTFPLDGKIKPSVAGVSENGRKKMSFHQQEWGLSLRKGFHSYQWRFRLVRKNFQVKQTVSTKEKSFPSSWNEGFLKKYVSTRQIKSLWFVLARKPEWRNGIKHLLKNTFPLYGKTASSGKRIENGFH